MPTDPLLGLAVGGSYRITRLLGEGGMGKVYEARHVLLPRRGAVKVLQPELSAAGESFERFRREAEVASSLGSRHIVQVFDFGNLPNGSPYMLMEYLEGRDLATYLAEMGSLPPREVLKLMEQAVTGVGAAHEKQVIHRDLKPANLFLARESDGTEVLKVVDFGLSKVRGLSRSLTGLNSLGTPAYMSPEQIRSSRQVDQRADVYALGVTLFELLTGMVPFDHEQVSVVLDMVLTQPVPSIRAFRPALAPELDAVIARALAKAPDARYSTVFEFWSEAKIALGRCTGQDLAIGDDATARSDRTRPVNDAATLLSAAAPTQRRSPTRWRAGVGAGVLALVVVSGALWWNRARARADRPAAAREPPELAQVPRVASQRVALATAPQVASIAVHSPASQPPAIASAPSPATARASEKTVVPTAAHEAGRSLKHKHMAKHNDESAPALFNGI